MTGILRDARHALRSLRRTPGIALVALVTIALGVGANTAMFSVVHSVLLNPLPHPDPDRLVSLWPEKRWSQPMLFDVRERVDSYEAVAAYTSSSYTLLGEGPAEMIPTGLVSATYFDVLGATPLLGGGFTAGDANAERGAVVMLSHGFWQSRYGGDPGVIGSSIRLAGHGLEERTVVGVLPAGFWPGGQDAWVPLVETQGQPGWYGPYGLEVVGRLRPGVSAARASAELRGLVEELTPLYPTQFRPVRYSPVDVVPLLERLVREVRPQLLVLMGAVGFILLIACTNVANLLLARASARRTEVAVRSALGGSRGRLARQILTESVVLGALGGVLGIAAAFHAMPLVAAFLDDQLPRGVAIGMNTSVLGFSVVVSLLAGLVFGAAPALRASAAAPAELIRAAGGRSQSQSRGAGRLNDALVAAEIALCLVLLAGAGLMLKSVWQLTRVDPGYQTQHILTLQYTLPQGRYDSLGVRELLRERIEERLTALPGVALTGSVNALPLGGGWTGIPYTVEGHEAGPDPSQVVGRRIVSPDFFAALRIPLVAGRLLEAGDREVGGEAALVVNETFARQHWPEGGALGGRLLYPDGDVIGRIVGIVRDARTTSLEEAPLAEIYVASTQFGWPMSGFLLVRGSADVPRAEAVLAALRAEDPDIAVRDVRSMEAVVRDAAAGTRFYARLLLGFAALALLLGVVGVYGVMSYAVSRRTRELGVRIALGASPRSVVAGVMRRAMAPVAAGIAFGVAGALVLTRLLAGFVFEVDVADPLVLGAVALLLAVTGAAAAVVPAARAARVSPLSALQIDG